MSPNSSLTRCMYRALLRASKLPSVAGSDNSVVFSCLLHRTGNEDETWSLFLRNRLKQEENNSREYSYDQLFDNDNNQEEENNPKEYLDDQLFDNDNNKKMEALILFRKLLREVVSGEKEGIRHMQFPCHVVCGNPNVISDIIRREFRDLPGAISSSYDPRTREEVAFYALREINKKLAWLEQLEKENSKGKRHPYQPARHVYPLPLRPSTSYLQPGVFLIAHPNMTGYFRRSVVCILDHRDEGGDEEESVIPDRKRGSYGTYGLIVNRACVSPVSGKHMTLEEVLRPIPTMMLEAFGNALVKEGGPVHLSLQMVRSYPKDKETLDLGGVIIPSDDNIGTYYNGDVLQVAEAVLDGKVDSGDVSFFVGASCWMRGQLESEIERGFWLPCRGPLDIARSGICVHDPVTETVGYSRPRADLWLSMLSACGENEAKLAHLLVENEGTSDFSRVCDDYD